MNKTIDYILNRLGENSTWRGIILVLTSIGVTIDPDQAAKIIAGGLALVGVINICRKAPGSPDAPPVAQAPTGIPVTPGRILVPLIAALGLCTGCAFNKVELGSSQGTNTTTAVIRTYAIWPASVGLDKQKASAGKTLSIGTEGATLEGGGTNMVSAINGLVELMKLLKQ